MTNHFEIPKNWDEELHPRDYYSTPIIQILFEDEYYLIVNKPSGILVHPMSKNQNPEDKKNLLKLVKWQTMNYLYPIHRLDRPVSGIVVFAKTSNAAAKLKEHWHDESFIKTYYLLCKGVTPENGIFSKPLKDEDGVLRESFTKFETIKTFYPRFSFVKATILTGRNHQIRRHFAGACHCLIGDTMHGKGRINQEFRDKFSLNRIFLHAGHIQFKHPFTSDILQIECPLDQQLVEIIKKIPEICLDK